MYVLSQNHEYMKLIISIIAILVLGTYNLMGQECLNIDYKFRGYFYAGTSMPDTSAPGGYYEDQNKPQKFSAKIDPLAEAGNFQIVALPDDASQFAKGVDGFKVYVVNQTDSTIALPAQDSRLDNKRQVYYNGEWQDIEYLPSSWCGNSYHSVFIKPNEYWEFTAPCMVGDISIKFRFALKVTEDLHVYSNEFDGSFNEKQLTTEQGHNPANIMDPYNN